MKNRQGDKNGGRETRSEATLISQANDAGGLDQDSGYGSGDKCSDSGYALKIKEPANVLIDSTLSMIERQKSQVTKYFGVSNLEDGIIIEIVELSLREKRLQV